MYIVYDQENLPKVRKFQQNLRFLPKLSIKFPRQGFDQNILTNQNSGLKLKEKP